MTSRGSKLGKIAIYDDSIPYPVVRINSAMLLIRKKKDNITLNYSIYLFKESILPKFIVRNRLGSAQPHVTVKDLKLVKVNIPSNLKEQDEIANFFFILDQRIETEEKRLELLQKQKKAYMQKIFSQDLHFKDSEGNNFSRWEIKKANEIFEPFSKKNSSHLPILSSTQERGLVYREELGIDIKYNEDSLSSYKEVRVNDFVISLRSFQGGFELSDKVGIVSPAYTIFSKSIQEIHEIYFKHFFKTEHFINKLNTIVYGIRDGKSISFKEFGELKLNIPCYKEQQIIGDFLSLLDSRIDKVTRKIYWLNEQKKGLMQQMFL